MKTGIVLEGGGKRGIYAAGVLDVLLEHNIVADGLIGTSAGAVNGCSYVKEISVIISALPKKKNI